MELAIQIIADPIEHMKRESQDQEIGCFYCGGSIKQRSAVQKHNFQNSKRKNLIYVYLKSQKKYIVLRSCVVTS
jgi:hypothetical protein